MEIGLLIRDIRKSRGMSARELAQKIGLKSAQAILQYERGERQIGIEQLKKIANALNVNITDIVEGCTEEELSKAAVFQMASSELKKNVSSFIESIFHRFGIVSSYREDDTKHVYVTYNLKTYKINNQKYESMKTHIMNLFEGQIINLLELLDEPVFTPNNSHCITAEDRQKKLEQVGDFEVLKQFNEKADELFKEYVQKKEGE